MVYSVDAPLPTSQSTVTLTRLIPKSRIFLENNNKIQTISLVRKRLKLTWNITTRVQRRRFVRYKIEYGLLEFPILHCPQGGSDMPGIKFVGLDL